MNEIIEELKSYMAIINQFDKDAGQDASALHAYLIQLTNFMARANYIMADYNRKFREQKKKEYYTLAASSEAQKKYYSPTLAKDYIDAHCSDIGFVYELAERTSRLCTHTIDAIRTVVSSLKSERIFNDYQQA